MKRLKNIEGKNEQQLEVIKGQREKQLDAIKNYSTNQKRNKLSSRLNQIKKEINKVKLLCVLTNGTQYNFNKFTSLEQFCYEISSGFITIKHAKYEQNHENKLILSLEKYNPTNNDQTKSRSDVLDNARKFYNGRNLIIESFEDDTFLLPKEVLHKNQAKEEIEKKRRDDLKTTL